LLEYENGTTRLQVVYKQSLDRETQAELGSWNCYLQVHERGKEAQMINAYVSAISKKPVIVSRGY
jgi:hypothetical protein